MCNRGRASLLSRVWSTEYNDIVLKNGVGSDLAEDTRSNSGVPLAARRWLQQRQHGWKLFKFTVKEESMFGSFESYNHQEIDMRNRSDNEAEVKARSGSLSVKQYGSQGIAFRDVESQIFALLSSLRLSLAFGYEIIDEGIDTKEGQRREKE